jgi:rare lipoprotein A
MMGKWATGARLRQGASAPRAAVRAGIAVLLCVGLSGCGLFGSKTGKIDPKYGVAASPRVVEAGREIPEGGGRYHVGKSYKIAGKRYKPREVDSYKKVGMASWYGRAFHGRKTANGEIFNRYALSAAHPTLPLPSYVRVTNLANKRSVIVRVNDRGPFHGGRVIDVSERAAELLGFKSKGVAKVSVRFIKKASLDGKDKAFLLASYRGPGGATSGTTRPTRVARAPSKPATRKAPTTTTVSVASVTPTATTQPKAEKASKSRWSRLFRRKRTASSVKVPPNVIPASAGPMLLLDPRVAPSPSEKGSVSSYAALPDDTMAQGAFGSLFKRPAPAPAMR